MESSPLPVDKSYFYNWLEHRTNADPGSLESELLEAMQDGDVDGLKDIVSSMDKQDREKLAGMHVNGSGLLQLASLLAEMEVLKYFVEELGFDVNAGGLNGGVTPLSSAALFGEVAVARYLLDNGADPNKIEESGSVALHNAAKSGLSLGI